MWEKGGGDSIGGIGPYSLAVSCSQARPKCLNPGGLGGVSWHFMALHGTSCRFMALHGLSAGLQALQAMMKPCVDLPTPGPGRAAQI